MGLGIKLKCCCDDGGGGDPPGGGGCAVSLVHCNGQCATSQLTSLGPFSGELGAGYGFPVRDQMQQAVASWPANRTGFESEITIDYLRPTGNGAQTARASFRLAPFAFAPFLMQFNRLPDGSWYLVFSNGAQSVFPTGPALPQILGPLPLVAKLKGQFIGPPATPEIVRCEYQFGTVTGTTDTNWPAGVSLGDNNWKPARTCHPISSIAVGFVGFPPPGSLWLGYSGWTSRVLS